MTNPPPDPTAELPESPNGGGPSADNRLRTWLWVLGGLVAVLVVVLIVVLLLRDDDSGSASDTTTTTTTQPRTTTTGPTTSTTPQTTVPPTTAPPTTAPPPTTTVPYPPITDDPQSYAQYLFAAWENGSRANAANVADADAVNQMFSRAFTPADEWTFDNCNPAAGSLYCTWNGRNSATLTMTVRTLTGGLPIQVLGVQFG